MGPRTILLIRAVMRFNRFGERKLSKGKAGNNICQMGPGPACQATPIYASSSGEPTPFLIFSVSTTMATVPTGTNLSKAKGEEKIDPRCASSRLTCGSPPPSALFRTSPSSICSNKSGYCSSTDFIPDQSRSMNYHPHPAAPTHLVLLCGCEEPASTFTSSTPANPNRRFLKCRKMNHVVNSSCYRFLKGCYLWIW